MQQIREQVTQLCTYSFSPFRLVLKFDKVLAHVTELWFFMEMFGSLKCPEH